MNVWQIRTLKLSDQQFSQEVIGDALFAAAERRRQRLDGDRRDERGHQYATHPNEDCEHTVRSVLRARSP